LRTQGARDAAAIIDRRAARVLGEHAARAPQHTVGRGQRIGVAMERNGVGVDDERTTPLGPPVLVEVDDDAQAPVQMQLVIDA
jgi:hypothetical protein